MELRHIYDIAATLREYADTEGAPEGFVDDIEINVDVSYATHCAIDMEFYRQSNNMSAEGFEHQEEIRANIDGIRFVIKQKS